MCRNSASCRQHRNCGLDRGGTKFEVPEHDIEVPEHNIEVPEHNIEVLQHDIEERCAMPAASRSVSTRIHS